MKLSQERFLELQQATPSPVVKADLSGKTVIVIGANVGLGFEAAKHFASLNPGRLILGCRSEQKGKEAVQGVFNDGTHLQA